MKVVVFNMRFYKDYIPLKYYLSAKNKIYDVEYIGFEYSEYLPDQKYLSRPYYFIFDCKYEYYHNTFKSYNKLMEEKYLDLSIKIILYSDYNNYYIKFSDLFSCFNDKLLSLMSIYDYRELKLYDLYRYIEDLSKYFEINFGLEVRKD